MRHFCFCTASLPLLTNIPYRAVFSQPSGHWSDIHLPVSFAYTWRAILLLFKTDHLVVNPQRWDTSYLGRIVRVRPT